jgi:flagellin
MKINHNMSAAIANNRLLRNESSLAASVERLSTGFKINSSGDDAAGMAIATKMKAQIRGLNRASQNSADGVSVLETVDGALQEVSSMLQRMRELSVQAASDTNGLEDKKAIQDEIDKLTDEVDRVSTDTEFNKNKLLDGGLDRRVYANNRLITTIDTSDTVIKGSYEIIVENDARQAVMQGNSAVGAGTAPAGVVNINGISVEVEAGESMSSVYEKLRIAGEQAEVNIFGTANPPTITTDDAQHAGYAPVSIDTPNTSLVFVSTQYGSAAEMEITCDNPALQSYLGIADETVVKGLDAKISLGSGSGFSSQATPSCDGKEATITDSNGFKMTFVVEPGAANTTFTDPVATSSSTPLETIATGMPEQVEFDVTDIGTLTLQVGANQFQTMDIRIPSTSAKNLYIDEVDVTTITGAGRAISSFDKAIGILSETRSRVGAYQNRLDHAISSLDATEENMTAALSRIEDVDMAEEMTKYTQYNVLTQASVSVLTQANDMPQQVLQMLQ